MPAIKVAVINASRVNHEEAPGKISVHAVVIHEW